MPETDVIDDRWIRSVRHHIEAIRDEVKAAALQEFANELSLMALEEAEGRPEGCRSGSSGCHQAGAFSALGRAAEAARTRADDLLTGASRTSPDAVGSSRTVPDETGQHRTFSNAAERSGTVRNATGTIRTSPDEVGQARTEAAR